MSWHRFLIPLKAQQPLRALVVPSTFPVGMIAPFTSATPPALWLECDGSTISQTTYAALWTVFGAHTYGADPGGGDFILPDLRGRVVAGQDNMGGASANRLTDPAHGLGLNGDTLGDTGGQEDHTPTEAEMFAHTHSVANVFTSDSASVVDNSGGPIGNFEAQNTDSKGSSTAFNVVQPTIILSYIIFTGV